MKFLQRFILIITLIIGTDLSAKGLGYAFSGGGARGFAHIGVLKVLEENHIYPSYITGTSIGAIVGGFYASGYTAQEIENIVMNLDWDELLTDDVKRINLALDEKNFYENSVMNFQIKDWGIKLPKGLIGGRKLTSLLTTKLIHVQHINDFSKLGIPFRCISTNLETGDEYIWDRGFLPQALRSSMAIPSVFSPVEVNGKVLIDGGICRNFPVEDLFEMGADVVLGIDISSESMKKEDLDSAVKIMNQTLNLSGLKSNKEQIKKCTYYFKPPVTQYSILDFEKKNEILALGEAYARDFFIQHPDVLEELKQISSKKRLNIDKITDNVFIRRIRLEGVKKVSKDFIYDRMQLEELHNYKLTELEDAIERIYGLKFFSNVDFRFVKNGREYDLVIKLKESSADNFGVGFLFDSDTDGSVIINTMFLNSVWQGSKVCIGAKLDNTPEVKASYFAHTGLNPGIGFWTSYYGGIQELDMDVSNYVSQYKIYRHKVDLVLQGQFSSDISVGIGNTIEYQKSKLNYSNGITTDNENKTTTGSVYAFATIDNKERRYFPTYGTDFYAEYREFYYVSSGDDFDDILGDSNFSKFKSSAEFRFPFAKELAFFTGYEQSFAFSKPTISQQIYLGGFRDYDIDNFIKFPGIKLGEVTANNVFVLHSGLQYEIINNLYTSFEIQHAFASEKWRKILGEDSDDFFSYKGGIGYLSWIGPISVEIAKADIDNDLRLFFRVGFDW
jgi:NTE family protein